MKIKVLATPAVRRIAMENKVDLSAVPATGKLGRVLKGDVLEYLNLVPAGTNIPHPTLLKKVDAENQTSIVADDRVEPLKGIRKAMLKSMTESLVSFITDTRKAILHNLTICFLRKFLILVTTMKLM